MKKTIITIALAIGAFISNAQNISLTQMVLQDTAFQRSLDSLGLLEEIQIEAKYDDSYLREILPMVFSPNGEYFFNDFAKNVGRSNFYRNSLKKMEDISDYYQNHIKGFESDSMVTNHYTDDLGDVRENYIFYNKGVKVRLIQLFFIQGVQFKAWIDDTKFQPLTAVYSLK
jgi:hypothetical protein